MGGAGSLRRAAWESGMFILFSQFNSICRGQEEQHSLDFSISQESVLGASFETWPGQGQAAHGKLCAFHWSHDSLAGSTGFIYCLFIYRQY